MLSKNQVFNKTSINTSKNNLIKTISKTNQIITITTTINLMDCKPIIKIIKEVTLIRTKISNQDITIKTPLTMVSSKTILTEIKISKFIKEINKISRDKIKIVTIIIKQTIPITKWLNHIIILFLHLRITHK